MSCIRGDALPGVTVTVTISSPQMQGTRTAVTDVNGNYNFTSIPPGQYTVRFEMESTQTVTRTARIGLGQTDRSDADLRLTAVRRSRLRRVRLRSWRRRKSRPT